MIYFDTSFLVPLFFVEPTSSEVRRVLAKVPDGEAMTSEWTRLEFASVLAREVRVGGLKPLKAAELEDRFASIILPAFAMQRLTPDDLDVARQFLRDHLTGLRAPDALHLATAANNRAEAIYTLDKGMVRAGKRLRLPVMHGIRFSG